MPSEEFDREKLATVHRAVATAIADKNPDALAALYEEGGSLLPPTGQVIQGRAAITAVVGELLVHGLSGQRVEVDELVVSGDLALEAGRAYVEIRDHAGGFDVSENNYLIVHRRQQDGSWLMWRDIWTAVPEVSNAR